MIMNKRIEWLDIAKGITIILMVMGHTSIPIALSKYIWSFHMPLFFFASGLMYNPLKYNSIDILLRARIRSLLIPYLFFTSIVYIGYFGTEYQHVEELYYGWKGYALWFVPVLFISNLGLFVASKFNNKWCLLLISFASALGGYFLSANEIFLPFKIEVVPFALFFLISGYLSKKLIYSLPQKWWICLIFGLVSVLASQMLPKLDMCVNEFGSFTPNLINALIGIFFVLMLSRYLDMNDTVLINPIKWAGRNTLYIMAFSQLFNYWILIGLNSIQIPYIISLCGRYFLLFFSIYIASELIKRYLPFIAGGK